MRDLFKFFTKTSEGDEQYVRRGYPAALPEEIHRQFSLAEIKAATNNFDEGLIIGKGGFGFVYRGIDHDGKYVAVKRLHPESKQGLNEFRTEVQLLCQLRHQNLVPLIGSYIDKDENEMIIVYEFMQRGSLNHYLHFSGNGTSLTWKQRLEICIGAARGLHYLHSGAKQAVIHRDVKSSNILLDDKWVSKLCDFGLAKLRSRGKSKSALERIDSRVKGTWGYLEPEYLQGHGLSEKSDVFSFGVVLFEVLCARKAVNRKLSQDQAILAAWARRCIHGETIYSIIDPYLKGRIAPECFKIFVDIAYCCIREEGNTRPDMGEVEVTLELALEMQEKADSEILAGLDPHRECMYGEVSFRNPVSDQSSFRSDSSSSTMSHGSLDMSHGSLDTSYFSCASSRYTMAFLAIPFTNFLEPLTKLLSNAHSLHDTSALRAGLGLLLTFLSQNRSGIPYINEDAYGQLSLFLDSEVITKETLDIIELLSTHTSFKSKIVSSAALASIANVLDSNIISFKEQVLRILCNLTSNDVVCSRLVSLACIPKLVSILHDPILAKHGIIVLRNLCNNKEGTVAVAETSGCIASIADIVENGSNNDRENAVAVLLVLCSKQVQHCQLVMDEGIVPQLVDISVNGSGNLKASAMELLRLLKDSDRDCHEEARKERSLIKHGLE